MPLMVSLFILAMSSASYALTLTDAILYGISRSSAVEGSRRLHELSGRDRWRRFIFNEPQLLFSSSDDGVAETYGLSETIAFPGKGLALSQLDAGRERLQESEYKARKYEVANNIAQAYLDCATAQAIVRQQVATVSDMETLSRSLKARYESGAITQAENIGAELQLRQQQTDLEAARDRRMTSCLALSRFLDLSSQAVENVDLADDLDARILGELGSGTAEENRAEASLQLAGAVSSTAWWSQLPDFSVSANRNHYLYLPGSPSGKDWTTTYMVTVTFPLFFPFYETAEAQRLKAQASVDHYSAEIQLVHARADKDDARRTYQRSKRRLKELRAKDLALAEALMESALSSYKSGKLVFADLVLARKTLVDLRAQDIQMRNAIISSHLKCLQDCDLALNEERRQIQ